MFISYKIDKPDMKLYSRIAIQGLMGRVVLIIAEKTENTNSSTK